MHLTLGILWQSQAVFYALAFFQLDGFAVPAPAQVTQTVSRHVPKQKSAKTLSYLQGAKMIKIQENWINELRQRQPNAQ